MTDLGRALIRDSALPRIAELRAAADNADSHCARTHTGNHAVQGEMELLAIAYRMAADTIEFKLRAYLAPADDPTKPNSP